jgi:hypothetical protein
VVGGPTIRQAGVYCAMRSMTRRVIDGETSGDGRDELFGSHPLEEEARGIGSQGAEAIVVLITDAAATRGARITVREALTYI